MNTEKHKKYAIKTIITLKELARKAKTESDNQRQDLQNYYKGLIMGYYSIITLLKQEAYAFCIDQKKLGLADINPDIDLLGLHRNPDLDFGENNWTIDVMTEEKIKGYLTDFISLLNEQAQEAKLDADKPKTGYEDYNQGQLIAYHSVISLLKHQAFIFNIDEKALGLANINPDIDLRSIHKKG